MTRRWMVTLGALALALVALSVPPPPTSTAVPAPWTWVRVVHNVAVEPHSSYAIREFCPTGYTAISGGLVLPQSSRVFRRAEFPYSDEQGSSWYVEFGNSSDSSGTAGVVAECVETADLPGLSHNFGAFEVDAEGRATGTLPCLNQGEVVVTGGVSWDNVGSRSISANGPLDTGNGWHAAGYNGVAGAEMTMEVWCVDPSQVPGFTLVEHVQQGEYHWKSTITCPLGTRILNGGTSDAYSNASYPSRHQWTATGYLPDPTVLRAFCVNAGTPTVSIDFAIPSPDGVITPLNYAEFSMSGDDPAGFPDAFRCSIDGTPAEPCFSIIGYDNLAPGPHEFVAYNQTADGRASGVVTHRWTVDLAPPQVSPPRVPRVSLSNPVIVSWGATDDYAGVDHHDAAFWIGRADGTSTGWRRPAAWTGLTSPSVRLPSLAAGDTVCVSVRAEDGVGNVSSWTPPRCTSRPFDDRAIATSTAGWARATGALYWLGTITTTSAAQQRLARGGVHLRQVGVVVTVCPTCGSVQVKVGPAVIGTLSLERATTIHQRVLLLPVFSPREGTVTLTTTVAGKSVRVDGLVTLRATTTTPPP